MYIDGLCGLSGVHFWRLWRLVSWCWRRSAMHRYKWLLRHVRVSHQAARLKLPSHLWCTATPLYYRKRCSVCRIQTPISSWEPLLHDLDSSLPDRSVVDTYAYGHVIVLVAMFISAVPGFGFGSGRNLAIFTNPAIFCWGLVCSRIYYLQFTFVWQEAMWQTACNNWITGVKPTIHLSYLCQTCVRRLVPYFMLCSN